jgi:hypothetical protein
MRSWQQSLGIAPMAICVAETDVSRCRRRSARCRGGARASGSGKLPDQFTTYGFTQHIHVPVLNVVGDFDTLSCRHEPRTHEYTHLAEAVMWPS